MREMKIQITDQLYADLKRGAKARRMTVCQFAAWRLQSDRYDLVTTGLINDGHLTMVPSQKNAGVL